MIKIRNFELNALRFALKHTKKSKEYSMLTYTFGVKRVGVDRVEVHTTNGYSLCVADIVVESPYQDLGMDVGEMIVLNISRLKEDAKIRSLEKYDTGSIETLSDSQALLSLKNKKGESENIKCSIYDSDYFPNLNKTIPGISGANRDEFFDLVKNRCEDKGAFLIHSSLMALMNLMPDGKSTPGVDKKWRGQPLVVWGVYEDMLIVSSEDVSVRYVLAFMECRSDDHLSRRYNRVPQPPLKNEKG